MSKQSPKSIETKLKSQRTAKATLGLGAVIATFIAITPYLFYLHESVPDTQVWDTFLFTYDSKGFGDANLAMWILTGKAIPLLLLLIWFFTNRHWWYHALLVPIIMYVWQIIGLFNDDLEFIDELQFFHLIPIMAFVIPSIYLLRAQMFDKINSADKSVEELEEEFKIKPKNFIQRLGDYF